MSANACAKCLPVFGSQYFYTTVLFKGGAGLRLAQASIICTGDKSEQCNLGLVSHCAEDGMVLCFHGVNLDLTSLSISTEEVTSDYHFTDYQLIDN